MAKIVVYYIPWRADHEADPGEEPNGMLRCRVTVDGVEVKDVESVATQSDGRFSTVKITVNPSSIDHVPLSSHDFYADELPTREELHHG